MSFIALNKQLQMQRILLHSKQNNCNRATECAGLCLTALEVYNPVASVFQLHSQRFLRRESINRVVMIVGAGTLDTLSLSLRAALCSRKLELGQEEELAFIGAFLTGSAARHCNCSLRVPGLETDTDNSK